MSRPIRFRAWDKERKQMAELATMCVGPTVTAWVKTPDGFDRILVDGENADFMQFTGLKDREGKEIWEGDIVADNSFEDDTRLWRSKVTFVKGCFMTFDNENGHQPLGIFGVENLEVLGNIYENPELLLPKDEVGL